MQKKKKKKVCNHGIVRRFGHSQNVAYVQVGGRKKKKKAKSKFMGTFILKVNVCVLRLCTRSSVKGR